MVNFIPVQEDPNRYYAPKPARFKFWPILILVAVILVVATFMFFGDKISLFSANISSGIIPSDDQYQAVFLTTGQVYFGKLTIDGNWLVLQDVYYLQSNQNQDQASVPSNFQLIKLGSEIHGPEDKMYIDSRQVLFWENMTPESQVVQAIEKAR